MLSISAATLRNWEERYRLVQPERSGGGHRLYTRSQVEQLRFVKERIDEGLQPAEAHRLLGEIAPVPWVPLDPFSDQFLDSLTEHNWTERV